MKLSYDFEKYAPPQLTERTLGAVLQSRRDARRMLLLVAASNLIFISLGMLALALVPYSMVLSFVCLGVLGIYLSGSGVLAVLFAKKLMDKYGTIENIHLALNA